MRANGWIYCLLGGWLILLLFSPGFANESEDPVRQAAILYHKGEVAEARALLEKRIAEAPNDADAHLAYYQLRILAGEGEAVRKEYNDLGTKEPNNVAVQLVRAAFAMGALNKSNLYESILEKNGLPPCTMKDIEDDFRKLNK